VITAVETDLYLVSAHETEHMLRGFRMDDFRFQAVVVLRVLIIVTVVRGLVD
jgi:hypothetical protein